MPGCIAPNAGNHSYNSCVDLDYKNVLYKKCLMLKQKYYPV